MSLPKIFLIAPLVDGQDGRILTNSELFIKSKTYPALGLGYIAAMIEKHGYPIKYIDMIASKISYNKLFSMLQEEPPEVIGITINIATYNSACNVAKIARKLNRNCKIIVGGTSVKDFPTEIINREEFDIGVIGEGEYTIIELLFALVHKHNLNEIKGIVYKENGSVIITEPRPPITSLDDIPYPAYHLMPLNAYTSDISKDKNMTIVISSRGCPFNCLFCVKNERWRARSPTNFVDEIDYFYNKLNIHEFYFVDSTFTVNQQRVIEISKEIIKRKLSIIWQCQTRLDCVSFETLMWMRKAGCYRITCGIESGDAKVLKNINKKISIDQIQKAIKWARESGIEIFGSFILGWPGDTISSIWKTINFSKRLDIDFAVFGIATIVPGTPMCELAIKQGVIDKDSWSKFFRGEIRTPPISNFVTNEYDRKTLLRLVGIAYGQFYLRPRYILKRFKKIRKISEFLNHIRGFKNVLIEIIQSL